MKKILTLEETAKMMLSEDLRLNIISWLIGTKGSS